LQVDSALVLAGQTLAYTIYCIVMMLLVGWFGYRITKEGEGEPVKPAYFYGFVAFLAVLGVSLHLVTMATIPWVELDLNRSEIQADKTFEIAIENHEFKLPSDELVIDCNDEVMFDVTSHDLTYGFGLFRQDHSMVFQMQVIPGHKNDVLWHFDKSGTYTIRSTEYSGPRGIDMIVKDAVKVRPCK